jgi:hypothetical protein
MALLGFFIHRFTQITQIFLFVFDRKEGRDERLLVRGGHAAAFERRTQNVEVKKLLNPKST